MNSLLWDNKENSEVIWFECICSYFVMLYLRAGGYCVYICFDFLLLYCRIVSCSSSTLCATEIENSESDVRRVAASPESLSVIPEPSDMEDANDSVEKETSSNTVETNGSGSQFLKPCKSSKAGEPASAEVVQMWRENGFSRLIHLF